MSLNNYGLAKTTPEILKLDELQLEFFTSQLRYFETFIRAFIDVEKQWNASVETPQLLRGIFNSSKYLLLVLTE